MLVRSQDIVVDGDGVGSKIRNQVWVQELGARVVECGHVWQQSAAVAASWWVSKQVYSCGLVTAVAFRMRAALQTGAALKYDARDGLPNPGSFHLLTSMRVQMQARGT